MSLDRLQSMRRMMRNVKSWRLAFRKRSRFRRIIVQQEPLEPLAAVLGEGWPHVPVVCGAQRYRRRPVVVDVVPPEQLDLRCEEVVDARVWDDAREQLEEPHRAEAAALAVREPEELLLRVELADVLRDALRGRLRHRDVDEEAVVAELCGDCVEEGADAEHEAYVEAAEEVRPLQGLVRREVVRDVLLEEREDALRGRLCVPRPRLRADAVDRVQDVEERVHVAVVAQESVDQPESGVEDEPAVLGRERPLEDAAEAGAVLLVRAREDAQLEEVLAERLDKQRSGARGDVREEVAGATSELRERQNVDREELQDVVVVRRAPAREALHQVEVVVREVERLQAVLLVPPLDRAPDGLARLRGGAVLHRLGPDEEEDVPDGRLRAVRLPEHILLGREGDLVVVEERPVVRLALRARARNVRHVVTAESVYPAVNDDAVQPVRRLRAVGRGRDVELELDLQRREDLRPLLAREVEVEALQVHDEDRRAAVDERDALRVDFDAVRSVARLLCEEVGLLVGVDAVAEPPRARSDVECEAREVLSRRCVEVRLEAVDVVADAALTERLHIRRDLALQWRKKRACTLLQSWSTRTCLFPNHTAISAFRTRIFGNSYGLRNGQNSLWLLRHTMKKKLSGSICSLFDICRTES